MSSDVQAIVRRSKILDPYGRPARIEVNRRPTLAELEARRSGIDAAAAGRHHDRHFTDADGRPLSAVLSADLATVRKRLRYECRNNGDARGMIETLATVIVGTDATLQVHTGDADLDRAVEDAFGSFAEDCAFEDRDVGLAELVAQGVREQCTAGEDFLTWTTDPEYQGAVKLRLQTIAAERIATPWTEVTNGRIKDGVEYDARNRKLRYHVSAAKPEKDPCETGGPDENEKHHGGTLRVLGHRGIKPSPGELSVAKSQKNGKNRTHS